MSIITNPTWWWLPPLLLLILTSNVIIFGYYTNWKIGLYILFWGLIPFILMILLWGYAYTDMVKLFPDTITIKGFSIRFRQLTIDNKVTLQPIATITSIIIATLMSWLVAGSIYPFIRKKMIVKSNTPFKRALGTVLPVIGTLPIVMSSTVIATSVSNDTVFDRFSNKVLNGMSGGLIGDSQKEVHEVTEIAATLLNVDEGVLLTAFEHLLSGKKIVEKHDTLHIALSSLLNSKLIVRSLGTIVDGFKYEIGGVYRTGMDLVTYLNNQMSTYGVSMAIFDGVVTKQENKEFFLDMFMKTFLHNDSNNDNNRTKIQNYLYEVKLFA